MHQAARGGDAIYNSPSQSTRRGEMKVSLCRRHCFLSFVTRGRMIRICEWIDISFFFFFGCIIKFDDKNEFCISSSHHYTDKCMLTWIISFFEYKREIQDAHFPRSTKRSVFWYREKNVFLSFFFFFFFDYLLLLVAIIIHSLFDLILKI